MGTIATINLSQLPELSKVDATLSTKIRRQNLSFMRQRLKIFLHFDPDKPFFPPVSQCLSFVGTLYLRPEFFTYFPHNFH
jgi:hypothetical protein